MESDERFKIDINDYKPAIISQQSKNEQPLFQDKEQYKENLKKSMNT